ncbi:MAG: hypothetical protein JNL70_15015 [Saprospiraceae bacterium]|nr:hypothetical protein [Saprospiraceae bacterium]
MTKQLFIGLLFAFCLESCDVKNQKELQLAPLSISGKIDCPQRRLATLNPNDFLITLKDSLGEIQLETRPSADGRYFFENLDVGRSYSLRVKRTTPANTVRFATNQVEDYLNQIPLPIVSGLALVSADVDKSGEIDQTDVLHLKRFMSGVTPSLPGGTWRFLESYLIDTNNNIIISRPHPLSNLQASVANFDFIMIQLGDMTLNNCN